METTAAAKKEAFPVKQLSILLAVRLVEPLAVNSIVPYLFPMVKFLAPALSDIEATKRVTLLFSVYAFAQFGTNIAWGRLSDRVGRRPTMLFGLVGVFVGTLGFGLSTSIPALFVFRLVAGLLSGNVVITRAIIGDIVRDRQNKARAFAWNQTAYQIGQVIGPIIGGYLVEPCTQVPALCRGGRFAWLASHPYALPNLVIAVMIATSFFTAFFFLNETLPQNVLKPSAPTSEQSPLLRPDSDSALETWKTAGPSHSKLSVLLSPQVRHIVVSYACLALHSFCFDQVFPVFLSTGPNPSSSLPFGLRGGLGYNAPLVANLIAASGILSIFFMVVLFTPVDKHYGTLLCMRASMVLFPLVYVFLPYLVVLPEAPHWVRLAGVSAVIAMKTLAAVFAFNGNAVLLTVAAPWPGSLGLVNGVAQTAAAGARAIGPAILGVVIGWGDSMGSDALGWWFLALVAMGGAVQAFWRRRRRGLGGGMKPGPVEIKMHDTAHLLVPGKVAIAPIIVVDPGNLELSH
ncbi:major facilitator superfamily transporter multidrug resistance [Grosmannia clavigera kw1407]|uniref:Major facilitator superfamily transporter multidrug resistance n=1 Tax=Grosmannia clavigera (strain kw1407 / UAMH 11150) TaxID=655863 RepID=F0XKM2_GROCL|nr:major facilitator superfamily transporter multidrug resistance [Grosmannia clavigera kw1407]EFX01749.1 major facilitator superfamily transporter multidrug resistance [Grosmannia clavigera kw1407]